MFCCGGSSVRNEVMLCQAIRFVAITRWRTERCFALSSGRAAYPVKSKNSARQADQGPSDGRPSLRHRALPFILKSALYVQSLTKSDTICHMTFCGWNVEIQIFLDFKLSPCFGSCLYSFGYFPDVRLWFADVSEHSICSIFKGWMWSMKLLHTS